MNRKPPPASVTEATNSRGSKKGKGNVDSVFWRRIKKLIKIVLPSYGGREARYIYFLSVLLVVRTMMSIWLADVNGRVVKAIVNKSFPEFLQKVSFEHAKIILNLFRFSTSSYSRCLLP